MADYETIAFAVEDRVARVTLNRPEKRNAMSAAFWRELPAVFARIAEMPDVRAAVIASTGPHFTAGIDLAMLAGLVSEVTNLEDARRRENLRRMVLALQECFNALERAHVPVLAAVQGGCIGGGIDMITACDMRYCTEDAYFVVKEIEVGMTADLGTLQRLPRVMPDGLARELAYTGRVMPASEAKDCGLVNAVFADQATMLEHVIELARRIAGHSPLAVAGTKEMLNYGRDHSVADGLNHIATWQAGMFLSEDLREAAGAMQDKRAPVFQDLVRGSTLPK
ncbi:MAG TPA: crotonase/enoyl-CoA hydratase family protein [Alphaproteobacteria bacterium]|nr:crotonase/enoyl-CoA hydratase family protein [Alphaproteobacteria bacterium]